MNEYLGAMTEAILSFNGTVDKFIGDGIMAFFGAPVADTDAPLNGVLAATRMTGRLEELNTKWKKEGNL